MYISFRVYRSHDYDLMVLSRSGALNLLDAASKALIAEAHGQESFTIVPEDVPRKDICVPTNIHIIGTIDDKKCEDLIKKVPNGARCSWIKCLIRKYLKGNGLIAYDGDRFVVTPVNEASGSSIRGRRKRRSSGNIPQIEDPVPEKTEDRFREEDQTPASFEADGRAAGTTDIFALLGE